MAIQQLRTGSGDTLIVHDEGAGPLVALVSGLGGTAAFWERQRAALTAAGYRVLSFDQPGCGGAPPPAGEVTIAGLAAMTGEMLARLAPGRAPAAIVGHSTGGVILQDYLRAGHGPRPGRVLLSGTWSRACPYMQSLFAFRVRSLGADFSADYSAYAELTWLLGVTPADVAAPPARAPSGPDRARAATQAARMRALLDFDGEEALAAIAVPTLVTGASDDRIVPAYNQTGLAARIPGAELHMLPDGGHFYPQSRSGAFNRLLLGWLAAGPNLQGDGA